MGYKLLDPQPGPRAVELDYDQRGPGLYPGETALDLGSRLYVAVSVEPTWLDNGAGVDLWGNVRWIEKSGATHLTAAEQHVETNIRHSAPAEFLKVHPLEVVMRETLLLLIGETVEEPAVMWSDEVRAQASIRTAVESVRQAKAPDAAALLGLA